QGHVLAVPRRFLEGRLRPVLGGKADGSADEQAGGEELRECGSHARESRVWCNPPARLKERKSYGTGTRCERVIRTVSPCWTCEPAAGVCVSTVPLTAAGLEGGVAGACGGAGA